MVEKFSSVYRIQMNAECTFAKIKTLIPYLKELGVEGIYFSPYFVSYKWHGYDIVDATKINPILGSQEEFYQVADQIHAAGLAHIIDIVPNHMGMQGNRWWQDLLTLGPESSYASFFDVNWHPEKKELHNKVLLPILQSSYQTILSQFEIQLRKIGEGYLFLYKDYQLPLSPHTYPHENDVAIINQSAERLHELLEQQYYRLSYWAVATHEINYRRFFNINELIALRIEEDQVLQAHHHFLFSLMQKKIVDGVRIDHPDGLYDPASYFKKLKEISKLPLIVEKILSYQEQLPASWKVEGSVGYEYLNALNGLFVYGENDALMHQIYENFVKKEMSFEEILYHAKKLFTNRHMVSEIENLAFLLDKITEADLPYREFTRFELTEALQEIMASWPVYRTYIEPLGMPSKDDQKVIQQALTAARKRARWLDPSLFDFFEKLLLCELPLPAYRTFILRFQQLTGPIMAKGLEDTAFYIFNRLISLNEVGGDLSHFGCSIDRFHRSQQEKREHWPLGFFPSSTHDTKRSEDVRMRIHVLSELPEEWEKQIQIWSEGVEGISRNDLYYIYQTLIGIWPRKDLDEKERELFLESRLWPLILKSIREASVETTWQQPDQIYENKVYDLLRDFLSEKEFMHSFILFQKKIDLFGILNSLSAQVLRFGCCGVIDIYQGNEVLQYSLMDPDNRITVPFHHLQEMLQGILKEKPLTLFREERFDELKLWLVRRMLQIRGTMPLFFLSASYIPLETKSRFWVAYMRKDQERTLVVMARRYYALSKETRIDFSLPEGGNFRSLFTEELFEKGTELPFQWYINE